MEVSDLFGEGSTVVNGKLIIPRDNLTAVGLDPGNNDPAANLAAVFLVIEQWFKGSLLDFDGVPLVDADGSLFFYDNPRSDPDLAFWFIRKAFSSDETVIYWRWLISFYELQV